MKRQFCVNARIFVHNGIIIYHGAICNVPKSPRPRVSFFVVKSSIHQDNFVLLKKFHFKIFLYIPYLPPSPFPASFWVNWTAGAPPGATCMAVT
ncbi:hypothetical protein RIF29_28371 [Crotalaria pallida]|uniref:Uncharacterized protein n=1 Tax=Crotalaria pallida TaxID=3830 RepID=A0AAN9HZN4_CROPI